MLAQSTIIGVIGGSKCTPETAKDAERVGELIATRDAALVCGGLGGVMEAASKGAASRRGDIIGILPGDDAKGCNKYITYPIPTGMGHARNVIIVHAASALVALPGETGTLSEIALALKTGKPVVSVNAWSDVKGVVCCASPDEAVSKAFELIGLA